MRRGLTIGDVSEKTQVNIETIRYYERIGLVPAPPRTAGGRRQYDSAGIARLQFIRRARKLGFSIDEIRALLAMTDGGAACGRRACADRPPSRAGVRQDQRLKAHGADTCRRRRSMRARCIERLSYHRRARYAAAGLVTGRNAMSEGGRR